MVEVKSPPHVVFIIKNIAAPSLQYPASKSKYRTNSVILYCEKNIPVFSIIFSIYSFIVCVCVHVCQCVSGVGWHGGVWISK